MKQLTLNLKWETQPARERERERESNSTYFTFRNLLEAYYQCRKSKRRSQSAVKFEINFEKKILKILKKLQQRIYKTGKYVCFAVSEPKIREVWAADFQDRILHHLLVSHLEPVWEKIFISNSFACRENKGAHLAVKKLKKIIWTSDVQMFYLQIDVESFFMNINKKILFDLIARKIKNHELLYLAKLIIFQNPTQNYEIRGDKKLLDSVPKHKSLFHIPPIQGLPIGNYTSQFFANVYLNEVDQFVKHNLKCQRYFRYMDDLLLLSSDKKQLLKWRNEISAFLKKKLRLKLHPKKQILQPVEHGINFLGYIVKPDHSISRKRIVSNLKKKLRHFNMMLNAESQPWPKKLIQKNRKLGTKKTIINNFSYQLSLPLFFPVNIPDLEIIVKAQATVNSYYGHFRHACCKKLRVSLYFNYFKELKKYLEPADRNFSHFVINSFVKNLYQEKTVITGRGERRSGNGCHY